MGKVKPTQRINDVVQDIKDDNYRLPSIQRSFVWQPDRICKLMDSLMSDYPIGSFLIWKPPDNKRVRTRKFIQDYLSTGTRPISAEESNEPRPYLILDGQQRLQSLFIGFFGNYDSKQLYFKTDSNPIEEQDHLRYQFQFLSAEEASEDIHWLRLKEIIEVGIPKISGFVDSHFGTDSDEVKERIKENLGKFIQVFNIEERLPIQDVKEDLPYNDVLEVFVRVNSGGMVLSKSDLVFSTVVLSIPDMERKFIELVDELNGGGEFDFDIDFIIKASFVSFGKGAKYDTDKLEDEEYTRKLKNEFGSLRNALLSTMEFLKTDAKILSKRFLKSDLSLIPIVDFIYRQPHQQLTEGQAWKLRQHLYMSFFMRFYSYGADGKLDVIHKYISEYEKPNVFPVRRISKYMSERTKLSYALGKTMLSNDLDLILNIIQGGVAEIPQKRGWSLERDHIFPSSVLEDKGIPYELINSVGNMRLINKTRNILKSDKIPAEDVEFFGSGDAELHKLFLTARKDLNEANFNKFAIGREELIFNKVKDFLRFDELDAKH